MTGGAATRRVALPSEGEGIATDLATDRATDLATDLAPARHEAVLDGVALITDRGLGHRHNDDAVAAGFLDGGTDRSDAVAVAVCDGVSECRDAHVAAVAASRAGVDGMLAALAAGATPRAAVAAGLAEAATAAARAGLGIDPADAPSCTYTAALVAAPPAGPTQITVGNVGDGRAYWLPDPPGHPQRLTVDDTLAQELITDGAAPDSHAVRTGAHTLTRWLGADSDVGPWSDWGVRTVTAATAGSLVLCTDGFWNYLPDARAIARLCTGADASAAARTLVEHALHAGGRDNVTVAVIPIGATP